MSQIEKTILKNLKAIDKDIQNLSDIGQQLQFQLTQANNTYKRAQKAQSDIQSKWNKTKDSIVGNFKG